MSTTPNIDPYPIQDPLEPDGYYEFRRREWGRKHPPPPSQEDILAGRITDLEQQRDEWREMADLLALVLSGKTLRTTHEIKTWNAYEALVKKKGGS